jgi:hypothetical protein
MSAHVLTARSGFPALFLWSRLALRRGEPDSGQGACQYCCSDRLVELHLGCVQPPDAMLTDVRKPGLEIM